MEDISYQDFLKELKLISSNIAVTTDAVGFGKKKSATEIYEELCLDYPLVTANEIQLLHEHLLKSINNTKASNPWKTFPIFRREFLDGIQYGARKYQLNAEQQTSNNTDAHDDYIQIYYYSLLYTDSISNCVFYCLSEVL